MSVYAKVSKYYVNQQYTSSFQLLLQYTESEKNNCAPMVKSPKLLKVKRKANLIEVSTPPSDLNLPDNISDFDSSFLSICCLLQSESPSSVKLVTESQILSRILERTRSGIPRHIEEYTLGAFYSAITWVPAEIVDSLINEGLLDLCQSVVDRSLSNASLARVTDRSGELALDILHDLVHLNDGVGRWLIERIESYVRSTVLLPTSFPSVVLKRALARLVCSLVVRFPECFVSGLPESRISSESLRSLFTLCNSDDVETSCHICLSALALEEKFGSNVCPAVNNIALNFIAITNGILEEACILTGDGSASDEESLRLSHWRSRIRGISTFVEHVAGTIEESVAEDIERTDNIEDKKFFVSRTNRMGKLPIEFNLIPKLDAREGSFFMANITPLMTGQCGLDDRDIENIYQLVGYFIRISNFVSFRFSDDRLFDNSAAISAVRLLHLLTEKDADQSLASPLVYECLDLFSTYLLSIISGKNSADHQPSQDFRDFTENILKKIARESEREIADGDGISCCIFEIVQLLTALSPNDIPCKKALAELLVVSMSGLTEKNMTEPSVCSLMEAVFVVFGESDMDCILMSSNEWVVQISNIAVFLNSRQKLLKIAKNDRSQYLAGTIENIKAFVNYKRNS